MWEMEPSSGMGSTWVGTSRWRPFSGRLGTDVGHFPVRGGDLRAVSNRDLSLRIVFITVSLQIELRYR